MTIEFTDKQIEAAARVLDPNPWASFDFLSECFLEQKGANRFHQDYNFAYHDHGVRSIEELRELFFNAEVECCLCPTIGWFRDSIDMARAALTAAAVETWACKARGSVGGNTPQDCDWPMCGCDPYANRVVNALRETGAISDHRG